MTDLPATQPQAGPPLAPGKGLAASAKAGALRMLGKAKIEAGEAIEAVGVSVQRLHMRILLIVAGLLLMLFLGALFRSWGLLWVNYILIALFGLGAIYAFLQPVHVAGMLAVGGGVAVIRDMGAAGNALLGYAKILGRIFLAFLIPLLLFALAPGDRSLGSSLPFIVLAPVVVLAMWLFGRLAPRVETFVFIALPLLALTIAVSNMLIPERMLAALGIPAWLRTGRPQDEELARLETLMEKRRNEAQAAQLREIRGKLERNEPLTDADLAVVAQAQKDRVTLTGWFGDRYKDVEARVAKWSEAKAAPKPAIPAGGTLSVPSKGWSATVAIPAGLTLCMPATHRVQCHPAGKDAGLWHEGAARCTGTAIDGKRFRARRGTQSLRYSYVPAGSTCPAT
ncbi:hypothetical protein [Sphingomonas sp. G-3-2-10]|uniref:hypothetical protein n=1 Tax=Sphingomonas sp. G-3-2-10 TaxID=2728838 RepID=UPI00146B1A74|nr:hypothetical protein [Sphingomonas sp. G-3-2-10]NML06348.1 hypothetical protein [Sphingomonas sp. G-3-2-10]